jgi:hypothetical protein
MDVDYELNIKAIFSSENSCLIDNITPFSLKRKDSPANNVVIIQHTHTHIYIYAYGEIGVSIRIRREKKALTQLPLRSHSLYKERKCIHLYDAEQYRKEKVTSYDRILLRFVFGRAHDH